MACAVGIVACLGVLRGVAACELRILACAIGFVAQLIELELRARGRLFCRFGSSRICIALRLGVRELDLIELGLRARGFRTCSLGVAARAIRIASCIALLRRFESRGLGILARLLELELRARGLLTCDLGILARALGIRVGLALGLGVVLRGISARQNELGLRPRDLFARGIGVAVCALRIGQRFAGLRLGGCARAIRFLRGSQRGRFRRVGVSFRLRGIVAGARELGPSALRGIGGVLCLGRTCGLLGGSGAQSIRICLRGRGELLGLRGLGLRGARRALGLCACLLGGQRRALCIGERAGSVGPVIDRCGVARCDDHDDVVAVGLDVVAPGPRERDDHAHERPTVVDLLRRDRADRPRIRRERSARVVIGHGIRESRLREVDHDARRSLELVDRERRLLRTADVHARRATRILERDGPNFVSVIRAGTPGDDQNDQGDPDLGCVHGQWKLSPAQRAGTIFRE